MSLTCASSISTVAAWPGCSVTQRGTARRAGLYARCPTIDQNLVVHDAGMGRRRRDSGHGNKLDDDSSGWGMLVIVAVIVVAMGIVLLVVWTNAE